MVKLFRAAIFSDLKYRLRDVSFEIKLNCSFVDKLETKINSERIVSFNPASFISAVIGDKPLIFKNMKSVEFEMII
jgi:hypothetical protein